MSHTETEENSIDRDDFDGYSEEGRVDSIYDEAAEFKTEEERYSFLHFAVTDESSKDNLWLHDQIKQIIRVSREIYGHPVPEDEFFGL